MLRKPATTTPKQFQTTWCFINQVSAVLPTPPDSGKTPQLRTSKLGQNCGKTEILHLQPSYGICWSHEIETLPPMWTKDSSGFKYILLFFNRMILNSGRHTQPDPQSCRVRSLGGRRGGTPKTNNASRDQNKNWAVRRPIVTKRSTANANTEKSIPPAMSQRNQHLTHAMLRKPATTTPKQFQTTWCFINQVSAVLPTPPDSGKTPQLRTSKLAQNCGKTEILHLQPSYGICWSHEIETLPPMWTKDSSGFKYILLFFNRMILNSGRHTQPDPQSCRVRSQGGQRGGQTTHQETKTNLSSATPNREKTIHCQGKRRKRHPTSNVAAEYTQTIPNNIVLCQRLATCSFAPGCAGNLPRDPALAKRCCLLKLRQFWQKRSLQQSYFQGRRHIGFLDSKKRDLSRSHLPQITCTTLASTEWQDSGEDGCWLQVSAVSPQLSW